MQRRSELVAGSMRFIGFLHSITYDQGAA